MKVQDTLLTRNEAKALWLLISLGWVRYERRNTGRQGWDKRWRILAVRATHKIHSQAGRKPGPAALRRKAARKRRPIGRPGKL